MSSPGDGTIAATLKTSVIITPRDGGLTLKLMPDGLHDAIVVKWSLELQAKSSPERYETAIGPPLIALVQRLADAHNVAAN